MDEVRALKREVRRLEYELKASVGHLPLLRSMVEGSRDGLALLSDEGRVIEHNSAFAIMLGTAEGLLGAPLDALLSRHDSTELLWPPSNDDLPLIVNPQRGEILELVIARIDTDARRLWVANIRLLTEATLQMRALAEARRRVADLTVELDAQRRFAALFEHSPDALLLFGPSGRVLQRNALAARWWPDVGLGNTISNHLTAIEPHLHRYCAIGGDCSSSERAPKSTVEWCASSSEGEVFIQATLVPIVVPDGCGALMSARDITAHRGAEKALEAALAKTSANLAERDVLLKEVHHRVKNNLQIVSSLLSMQSEGASSSAERALLESAGRVRSMALVHEMLYGSDDLAHVEISSYLETLSLELRNSLCPDGEIRFDLVPVDLTIEQAIPAGLLANELLTNAFKYGRSPDGRCRVTLSLQRGHATEVVFSISDEGPGLPSTPSSRTSLGMTIAHALARQLGGRLHIGHSSPSTTSPTGGARLSLCFSIDR